MDQLQSLRSCLNCKSKKKKCSRNIPKCVTCSKLLLKCVYPPESPAAERLQFPERSSDWSESHPTSRPLSSQSLGILDDNHSVGLYSDWRTSARLLASLTTLFQDQKPSDTAMFHASVMNEVSQIIVDNGGSLPALFKEYYRTIDAWLPGIVPQSEILSRVHLEPSVDLALLLLSMFLVILLPNGKEMSQTSMHNSIYFLAKSLLSTLLSAGITSLDIMRAAVLLLLYEVGHGMNDQAYISTALCYKLGLKFVPPPGRSDVTTAKETNGDGIWWSIVMLDRYLNLGVAPNELDLLLDRSCLQGRTNNSISPLKRAIYKPTISAVSLPESRTAFNDRNAAFIQAIELLGQVYEYTRLSQPERGQDSGTHQALDLSLQSLLKDLLTKSTRSWEESCESIGLCFSALFSLHEARFEREDKFSKHLTDRTKDQSALMAIKSIINMVLEIAENANARADYIDLAALPIPSTYATYRAAMFHIETSSDCLDTPKWRLEMNLLESALGRYGSRWVVGKHYLSLVQDSLQKARLRKYNQVLHNHIIAS